MPVPALIAVGIVLFAGLLFVADRVLKAIERVRRRKEANRRLVAAATVAESKVRQGKAAAEASGALTSVMPTIHDVDPRVVDQPSFRPPSDPGSPARVTRRRPPE